MSSRSSDSRIKSGTKDLANDGILKTHIGARFSLDDTALAHVAVETGSVIGNVVVTVD
jgi:NADPH:quinone reductase-like Zn-dependent oxidoreductase